VIDDVVIDQRQHRVNESDQAARLIEGADGRRFAGFRDHIEPDGHDSDILVFPDGPLQLDTLLKVFYRYALPDDDIRVWHKLRV
jgi:hypothetical protein